MNLKNKGIVIVVKQKKTIELVHYSTQYSTTSFMG